MWTQKTFFIIKVRYTPWLFGAQFSVLRNKPFPTESIFSETCLLSVYLVTSPNLWTQLYYNHLFFIVFNFVPKKSSYFDCSRALCLRRGLVFFHGNCDNKSFPWTTENPLRGRMVNYGCSLLRKEQKHLSKSNSHLLIFHLATHSSQ